MQRSSPRPGWTDVPPALRTATEALLDAPVESAASRAGGWSPGAADVLRLADGRQVFVKAVSSTVNARSVAMHRREAAVLRALAGSGIAPAPALVGVAEADGWIAHVVEHVEGRHPDPRSDADTSAVLDAVAALPLRIPAAVPRAEETARDALADGAADWRRLQDAGRTDAVPGGAAAARALAALAATAGDAVAGDGLVHADLRPDNVLIRPDGTALLVDWPNAIEGLSWFDALTYVLDIRRQGGDADRALRHTALVTVAGTAIDAVLAALAGYFFHASLEAEPPGMQGIREFQRVQGGVAVDWLRHRGAF